MRETDELLVGWFDRHYASAPEAQKAAFRRLLELPDPVLIGYLLGLEEASDQELKCVIGHVRGGTRSG